MTALERALVVYAEAKGYEIEVEYRAGFWKNKQYEGKFDFGQCEYKIKQSRGFELGPVTVLRQLTDEITKITNPGFESRKSDYPKPAGFSCKTVTLTREEIEEMNKPKEKEFDVKAYVKSLVQTPEYLGRYAKVTPFIMLMEAWAEGEKDIEFAWKSESSPKWTKTDDPHWNFDDVIYRAVPKPKQPEAIPATEEELKEMRLKWYKAKSSGLLFCSAKESDCISYPEEIDCTRYLVFDEQTKTWQDWISK